MVFELCMMKKGSGTDKLKFSCLFFLAFVWGSRALGGFFVQWTSKGFLSVSVLADFSVIITELLPYLKYEQPF